MSDLVPHLAELANKINAEHQQAETAMRAGLEHAKNAGELLMQAKAQCRHGEWLPWLGANVRFSERTVQAYMRIAKRWGELESKAQGLADLTFEDGLKLLAKRSNDDVADHHHLQHQHVDERDADGNMSEAEFSRRLRQIKVTHRKMLNSALSLEPL
jgi:glycine cleavage system regulatory protein